MAQPDINYLAVLVAGIISMIVGSLWYGPIFGKAWMRLMGFTKKTIDDAKKKGMAKSYLIMFVMALLMNYVMAHFVDYTDSVTFAQGMLTGFWIWLGFFVTTMIGSVLWEGKSINLYLLNVFHYLVVLLINGGILAVWV